MKRNRENLNGDLRTAAAEFHLTVDWQEDGKSELGESDIVRARLARVGTRTAAAATNYPIEVNRDAIRVVEVLHDLGWQVKLIVEPKSLPVVEVRGVEV